jgi:hypothetical protein
LSVFSPFLQMSLPVVSVCFPPFSSISHSSPSLSTSPLRGSSASRLDDGTSLRSHFLLLLSHHLHSAFAILPQHRRRSSRRRAQEQGQAAPHREITHQRLHWSHVVHPTLFLFVALRRVRGQGQSWRKRRRSQQCVARPFSFPQLVKLSPPFFHIASFHSSCPLRGAVQSGR